MEMQGHMARWAGPCARAIHALIHFSLEQLKRVSSTGGLEERLPKAGCLGGLCRYPAMAGHLGGDSLLTHLLTDLDRPFRG